MCLVSSPDSHALMRSPPQVGVVWGRDYFVLPPSQDPGSAPGMVVLTNCIQRCISMGVAILQAHPSTHMFSKHNYFLTVINYMHNNDNSVT